VRDVPKAQVATYVLSAGLLPALTKAAASKDPWAPAAQEILRVVFDQGLSFIDIDHADWLAGSAGLVFGGVIQQSDVDGIEALYVAPEVFTFTAIIHGLAVYTGDRGTQRSIPVGPNFSPEMI
jgi:hypothetical protein